MSLKRDQVIFSNFLIINNTPNKLRMNESSKLPINLKMVKKVKVRNNQDNIPTSAVFYGTGLENFRKKIDEGQSFYGQAIYPKEKRIQTRIFMTGEKGIPYNIPDENNGDKVSYIPPKEIKPTDNEVAQILAAMKQETVIEDEEKELIRQALDLKWDFSKIAEVFGGRTPSQLQKWYFTTNARNRRPTTKKQDDLDSKVKSNGKKEVIKRKRRKKNVINKTIEKMNNAIDYKFTCVVNPTVVERCGGESRVKLKIPLQNAPKDFTGYKAHNLSKDCKIKFYQSVDVVDADDISTVFEFNLKDETHCASFNIGEGSDGCPLLSWSDLYALYELPDGTQWAEHGYLYDKDDMEEFSKQCGKSLMHLVPKDMDAQELIKRKGRFHSRLQNIEYEWWIYKDEIPKEFKGNLEDNYFYRVEFDPDEI